MSNDHIKSEIPAYLAGGLPEARNRQIESHLADCEKCRQAVNKARGKLARGKREALKKASPDPLPNLFLARQGKEAGVDRPASKAPWVLFIGLLLGGLVFGILKHYSIFTKEASAPASVPEPEAVVLSSAPVVSSITTPAPEPKPEAPAYPIKVTVKQEWKGPESGIKEARLVVIRGQEDWNALWSEMQEKEPLPQVNFNRYVVVCVFAGGRSAGATIGLGRVLEMEKEEVVPYHVSGPEVAVSSTSAAAPSHPYLLSMIPRVEKKIRITRREVSE